MIYRKMTKAQAKNFIEDIDEMSQPAFDDLEVAWRDHKVDGYDPTYGELREKIVHAYEDAVPLGNYAIDLNVGLKLYQELCPENGFTNVVANDDDVWRYLSCKVFPDITYMRYPNKGKEDIRLNSKRFYSHTRRIWLKTLWWYVHLSWQGSQKATYEVLKDFGTDTISDFIERPGSGYRLKLFRELIRAYSEVTEKSANLFNHIATLNRVTCTTVEPALTEGAERGYVNQLLAKFSLDGDDNDVSNGDKK